jgi:hypothetical protein
VANKGGVFFYSLNLAKVDEEKAAAAMGWWRRRRRKERKGLHVHEAQQCTTEYGLRLKQE